MEDDDQTCTLDLNLELGLGGYMGKKEKQKVIKSVASSDLTFDQLSSRDEDETLDERGCSLKRLHEEQHHHSNEISFDDNMNESRKKLRLTKEQSAILEDTFKLHNTINSAQKRALAEQLNLKQRQVEVWFQNRRARTKLKETEVNCTLLKRYKDKLTEENIRLKKEIEELRALKVGSSSPYTQHSNASILTVCSSCKKLWKPNEGNSNEDNSDVVIDKS